MLAFLLEALSQILLQESFFLRNMNRIISAVVFKTWEICLQNGALLLHIVLISLPLALITLFNPMLPYLLINKYMVHLVLSPPPLYMCAKCHNVLAHTKK